MNKFGYVKIESNNNSALSNSYCNIDLFRKELFGKDISEETIKNALNKVNIDIYDKNDIGVFMFCPDDGIAIIGKWNERINDYNPSIRLSWKEKSKVIEGIDNIIEKLDSIHNTIILKD